MYQSSLAQIRFNKRSKPKPDAPASIILKQAHLVLFDLVWYQQPVLFFMGVEAWSVSVFNIPTALEQEKAKAF